MSKIQQWLGWVSAGVLGLAVTIGVAAAQPVAGKDYQILKPAQPVTTGKNIEVLDFFWYGCGGCNQLQAPLYEWLKRKPADVTLRRQPAAFQDSWVQLARTYHAIEAVDAVDKLHPEVFNAIHKTKVLNPATLAKDPNTLFDWVATKGIDRQKFESAYKSFGVDSKAKRTIDITSTYNIASTPTLVIDGKFIITPQGSYDQFFRHVDQLIDIARKSRGGK